MGGTPARRRQGRRGTLARAVVVGALVLGTVACSDAADDDGTRTTRPPESEASTTSTDPLGTGLTYEPPTRHASDWGAPDVALPDVTLPYGPSPVATADPSFYDVTTLDPAEVAAAEPGDVLRVEEVELTGPLAGASGWRVLYRSTDADGEPAVVSGMVLAPDGDAPDGGRPVVAWAHGTTGIADRCAPSATGNLFYDDYGQVGRDLLDQGFVVAATDYHGLGTPGVHTYHRSEELAHATIDSVAAAHDLAEVGPLRQEWFVVGHSEGGLAALASDAVAGETLPELDYRGVVVAAPTPDLGTYAPAMFAIEGRGYAVLLLAAVAGVAPDLAPSAALGLEAASREALVTHGCWEEAVPGFDDIPPEQMLADPDAGQRLADVLAEWAAYDPATVVGPMLVVQGEADDSVLPPLTAQLVDDLCAHRRPIEYRTYAGAGHDEVMAASSADAAAWMAARMAGEPAPTTCSGA
jgi:alpha-beta hydrolase superfamily lysophospholipase